MDPWFSAICAGLIFIVIFLVGHRNKERHLWLPSLANKHVLITGGSSGIGLAIAHQVIQQGGFVTLISYHPSEFEEALKILNCSPHRVFTKVADVGNYEEISNAVKESFEWRPFDIVVCNAGIAHKTALMEEMDVRDVERVIRTNLTGVVYTAHAAIPFMKRRESQCRQSLVIMGSMASMHPGYALSIYTASKHGLKGLATCLRLELLPFNIRVTFCCPNFTRTPLMEIARRPDGYRNPVEKSIDRIQKVVALYDPKRFKDPGDIAKAAIDGIKEGIFLLPVGNKFEELVTSSFGRGLYPAESVGRSMMEMAVFLMLRMVTHVIMALTKYIIKREHLRNSTTL